MEKKEIKEEDELIEAASTYNYDEQIEEEEKELSVEEADVESNTIEASEPTSPGKFKKILGVVLGLAILFLVISLGVQFIGGMFGSDPAVARVDGITITESELVTKYAMVPEFYREGVTPQVLLNQSLIEAILFKEATQEGFITSERDLDDHYQSVLVQLGTDEAGFEEQLQSANLTKEEVMQVYKQRLTIGMFLNATILSTARVSDEDVLSFFQDNPDQFSQGEQVRASHILVESEDDARTVLDEINAGADFGELAKVYSLDPGSGAQGGDLGFFTKEVMVAEFAEVAFSMDIGAVSEPVETQFGYHIIYVVDRKEATIAVFEDVKEDIEEFLLSQVRQDNLAAYISGLYMRADIEILHPDFADFPLPGTLDITVALAEEVQEEVMEEVVELEIVEEVPEAVEEVVEPVVEEVVEEDFEPVEEEITLNFCEGLSDDTVIYYYANWCQGCTDLLDLVQLRQVEENIVLIEESTNYDSCVDALLKPGLPNFVCMGSGEVIKGSVSRSDIENFLDAC